MLIEQSALPYLGLQVGELGLDEKAEILFLDEAYELSLSLSFGLQVLPFHLRIVIDPHFLRYPKMYVSLHESAFSIFSMPFWWN